MPRWSAVLTVAALGIAWLPLAAPAAQAASPDVVISQVYGGGGGTGATYNRDFVELFNRGASTVSLTGKSVQYASATGTGNFGANPVTLLSGDLAPGSHYLVAMASGPTGTISSTTAALRKSGGCTETDHNFNDFVVQTPNPRNKASAATPCSGPDAAPTATTTPADGGTMSVANDITVTFSEPVNVTGTWFTLSCTTSGAVTAVVTGGPTVFTLNPSSDLAAGESCTLTVFAAQVSDQDANDPPDTMASNYSAVFTVQDPCLLGFTAISAIQGSGPSAAITGAVTTEGVVTGDFEGTEAVGGFYLQDALADADPATSEGIFVFSGSANLVAEGDVVRVTGYARERYGQTTVNGSNSDASAVTAGGIHRCGTGSSLPATDVTLPFASAVTPEQYEGMLVRFHQDLVISGTQDFDRYGELTLGAPSTGEPRLFSGTEVRSPGPDALAVTASNALRTVILDDATSGQNPSSLRHPDGTPFALDHLFRAGDTVTDALGILGYDYSAYRLYPTMAATCSSTNPRPSVPTGGALRVASVNAWNYFLTGDGAGLCGPDRDMACRGWDADQPNEFTRQRAKLLNALTELNADIIGLTEVENTTGVEPLADLVAGMPGWAYVDTGTVGTDAIRSGLIYRTSAVTPVGEFKVLDASVDPRFIDTANRPTLAQSFRDATTGRVLTVAVNHFRSKGSACAGDPDLGDGQGQCPGTRLAAAKALMDWLATDPTGGGSPNVLVIGDLNAYSQEDPVRAVVEGADDVRGTGDDFSDLFGAAPEAARYSVVFDAQAGSLDHALASTALAANVSLAAVWHVNADESDVLDYDTSFKPASQEALYAADVFRFGDHDPLVIGINLPAVPPDVTPPPPTPDPLPTDPLPTTPVPAKQPQTVASPPSRLKRRGLTVLAPSGLRTSAGQRVTSAVRGKQRKGGVRLFRVVQAKGTLKVRTYGRDGVRLRLLQTAPGTDMFQPWSRTSTYVNGKRVSQG